MRTSVHLLLFVVAIAMGVGAVGPLIGSVQARDVRFEDLREGFAPGVTLDQLAEQNATLWSSLAIVLLGSAAAVLVAALTGSRGLAWLGILAGLAGLATLTWRLNERFDDQLRDSARDLLSGTWGLYLFGGGLLIALLAALAPRERRRA
ncbi:Uncharacterised protein [Nocardia otitidiscaviarum]|uniref:Uncharacterized protein n=1 Tax=Nocardia otitidiscaviarum TaxID=1823 RepID=A0A378YTJ8_9NOCA|nr:MULTISPECIES: hypothetical protein [Nocardia]MCP9624157.1 hypothetical protein [Nocardia otitidiscaviarum]QDP80608.1 hypothetical protein FOH10_19680 [Nocardia otitidiscaviarum]SUA79857.1 Uncharacterised protein [Nocardia otitidiscaviarum]